MEGPSAISILFPILAMGLPISDTAMAIFRRWVRNLPLSAADRRHVHHLLIGLGLNPRQAALMLYCFSGFLCGAVMLGVALRNEYLTLVLGISGCLVFLLVVTSRRDELSNLRDDLHERLTRKRQERQAAKLAWEAIQRIELCTTARAAYEIVDQTAQALGCELVQIACSRDDSPRGDRRSEFRSGGDRRRAAVSGPSAIFRLSCGQGLWITVSLGLPTDSSPAADIVFRYLQRLSFAGRSAGPAPSRVRDLRSRHEPAHAAGPSADSGSAGCLAAERHGSPNEAASPDGIPGPLKATDGSSYGIQSASAALRRLRLRCDQPGRRQDDLELLARRCAALLDGARRRRAAGDRVVDPGAQAAAVYLAKAEIEINPPEIDPGSRRS